MNQGLREEGFFQAMLEESSDLFTILDADGIIRYESPNVRHTLGYEPEELVGCPALAFVHPEDVADVVEGLQALMAEPGVPVRIEFRFKHKDGSWLFLESFGRNGLDNPQIQGVVVHSRDISERRRTEEALRESEARNRAILASSLDAIVTIDQHGDVLEWNPAAVNVFGYARREAVGRSLADLIIPADFREAHNQGMRHYLATGEGPVLNKQLELPAIRKDGQRILVELVIAPLFVGPNPIFTGFVRDVTQRRQAEDALRESQARYARTVANVPGVVYQFLLRPDGTYGFPFLSDAVREIHGVAPEEAQQNPALLLEMIPEEERESFYQSIQDSAATLSPWQWEGRALTRSGEKWIQYASRPRLEENGDILWDGLFTDITSRRRAEESVETARQEAEAAREEAESSRQEAERANRAKSEFLSRMSHELRTPLNAILGFGQLLERSALDARDKQSVEQILKGGRHLLDLINEVLDIARIESGRLTLSTEPVNVVAACREAISLIRPLAEARNITLHADVDADTTSPSLYVLADRQRLKQILLNLLSNAVKYNHEGGEVFISAKAAPDDRIGFCVRDTGPGIAADKVDLLFVPFERLGAEHTEIEGTGIGLALSERLANAMNGRLTAESEAGAGCAFWLDLPAAEDPISRLPAPATAPAPERLVTNTKWVVLYIEDNLSNLRLMQGVLSERPEIRLLTAMQGSIGLDLARLHAPDVILLDLHLPELSGSEIFALLQKDASTRNIPVIVVSADATRRQQEELLSRGARAYLTKPLDLDEFLGVLDEVLLEQEKAREA